MKLPKEIKWSNPYEFSPSAYKTVLIAKHKHSVRDWEIVFGYLKPNDNYSAYEFYTFGGNKKIDKDEILAIGTYPQYASMDVY